MKKYFAIKVFTRNFNGDKTEVITHKKVHATEEQVIEYVNNWKASIKQMPNWFMKYEKDFRTFEEYANADPKVFYEEFVPEEIEEW